MRAMAEPILGEYLKNHECTRMHTNFFYSTEYTEETECLADVGLVADDSLADMISLIAEDQDGLRLLGGFMRFAEAKVVMRKHWRFSRSSSGSRSSRSSRYVYFMVRVCCTF